MQMLDGRRFQQRCVAPLESAQVELKEFRVMTARKSGDIESRSSGKISASVVVHLTCPCSTKVASRVRGKVVVLPH